jgi:hypothetical protein
VIGGRPTALARPGDFAYFNVMTQPVSPQQQMVSPSRPSGGLGSALAWGGASLGAVVLLGAVALWFYYGTAIFFEMIASGISACF